MRPYVRDSQVVGALISHTGSGVSSEMDEALGALVKLTETPEKAVRLKAFMPFIQGLLDFIKTLSDAQVPNSTATAVRIVRACTMTSRQGRACVLPWTSAGSQRVRHREQCRPQRAGRGGAEGTSCRRRGWGEGGRPRLHWVHA